MATAAKAALYDSPEALSLVERMHAGDESAFNQLYATHHTRVLTVIQKYVDEHDIAEHIANGVFAKVWEVRGKSSGFKSKSAFTTWITRIAINAALMHLRSTKLERQNTVPLAAQSSAGTTESETPIQEYSTRDLNLEGIIDRKTIARALSHLPHDYRVVVVLRLVEGLTIEETCAALKLGVPVIKSRLFRARLMLRAWLQEKAVRV